MVRRVLTIGLLGLAAAAAAGCTRPEIPEGADGYWKARRPGWGDEVRIDLESRSYRNDGRRHTHREQLWFDLGHLEGLGEDAFRRSDEPLTFRWERDAGTFVFEGVRRRRPYGFYRFEPSAEFSERLKALGVRDAVPYAVALRGLSLELVDALIEAGYRVEDLGDVLWLDSHDVEADWLRVAATLPGPPSIEELIDLRRYGIGKVRLSVWKETGIDLEVEELITLQRYGLRPEDVVEYRGFGYDDVDAWLTLHRYGVPADLLAAASDDGVPRFDVEDVRTLRTQGIDGDWLTRVRAAAEDRLDVDDLVELRRYGVPAERYEEFCALGYSDAEDVRSFTVAGVGPEFLVRLRERGETALDVDEIVDAYRTGLERWLERRDEGQRR